MYAWLGLASCHSCATNLRARLDSGSFTRTLSNERKAARRAAVRRLVGRRGRFDDGPIQSVVDGLAIGETYISYEESCGVDRVSK